MIHKDTSVKEILALAPDCSCKSCTHGCTIGSGVLVKGESKRIAEFLGLTEEQLKKEKLEEIELFNKNKFRPRLLREGKPFGKCTFFNGKCSIHPVKPLQCRIAMGCKDYGEELQLWFMLNYLVDADDAESVRQFAVYLKSGGKTLMGGKLEDFIPDKKILNQVLNYEILR